MTRYPHKLRGHSLVGTFFLCTLLAGCGVEPAAVTAAAKEKEEAQKTIATLRADNAELKRQLGAEKVHVKVLLDSRDREDAALHSTAATGLVADAGASAPVHSVAMCFKDYCPCEAPQGGPDSVLCDQLEEGIEPDIQLMIAGRGMREARRQMATGDY